MDALQELDDAIEKLRNEISQEFYASRKIKSSDVDTFIKTTIPQLKITHPLILKKLVIMQGWGKGKKPDSAIVDSTSITDKESVALYHR